MSHRLDELWGAPVIGYSSGSPPPPPPPPKIPPSELDGFPPEKRWTWPLVDDPATYSAAGSPIRSMRHSSVSAPPVETAMSGMLSSVSPLGTVPRNASDLSGCGLSWHEATLILYWRRHLPIWMTSGTSLPTGTFVSLNAPVTSVVVFVSAPLWKSAPQEQASAPVGTPRGRATSGVAGT